MIFSRQNVKPKISTMMIQTQASRQSWFLQIKSLVQQPCQGSKTKLSLGDFPWC